MMSKALTVSIGIESLRAHTRKISNKEKGVGIFWSVKVTRDFFVSRWPGNERYSHVSVFHDRVESYLDIGDIYSEVPEEVVLKR